MTIQRNSSRLDFNYAIFFNTPHKIEYVFLKKGDREVLIGGF